MSYQVTSEDPVWTYDAGAAEQAVALAAKAENITSQAAYATFVDELEAPPLLKALLRAFTATPPPP
jgi:hypothetical protein